jgi:hypothetical protein
VLVTVPTVEVTTLVLYTNEISVKSYVVAVAHVAAAASATVCELVHHAAEDDERTCGAGRSEESERGAGEHRRVDVLLQLYGERAGYKGGASSGQDIRSVRGRAKQRSE